MFDSSFPRRLVYISWGWLVALVWYPLALVYRLSLRVLRRGLEHLEAHPGHILVFWHENLGIWFHTEPRARGRQVWMQHPALFMTPVHAMLVSGQPMLDSAPPGIENACPNHFQRWSFPFNRQFT